jgi:hypothetical protein
MFANRLVIFVPVNVPLLPRTSKIKIVYEQTPTFQGRE